MKATNMNILGEVCLKKDRNSNVGKFPVRLSDLYPHNKVEETYWFQSVVCLDIQSCPVQCIVTI